MIGRTRPRVASTKMVWNGNVEPPLRWRTACSPPSADVIDRTTAGYHLKSQTLPLSGYDLPFH